MRLLRTALAVFAVLLGAAGPVQPTYRGPGPAPGPDQDADYWIREPLDEASYGWFGLNNYITHASIVAADDPSISNQLTGAWAAHPYGKGDVDDSYEMVPMGIRREAGGVHFYHRRLNPRQQRVAVPGPWLRSDRAWRCARLGPRQICEFSAVDTDDKPMGFYQAELWRISDAEIFLGGIQWSRLNSDDRREDYDNRYQGALVLRLSAARLRELAVGRFDIFAAPSTYPGPWLNADTYCLSKDDPDECRASLDADWMDSGTPYGYNPGLLLTSGNPAHAGILDARLAEITRVRKIVETPEPTKANDKELAAFYGLKAQALSNLFAGHPVLGPLAAVMRDRFWALSSVHARMVNVSIGEPGLFDWGSTGVSLIKNGYGYFFLGTAPSIAALGSAAMTFYQAISGYTEMSNLHSQHTTILAGVKTLERRLRIVQASYATRLPTYMVDEGVWGAIAREDAAAPPYRPKLSRPSWATGKWTGPIPPPGTWSR